MRVLGTFKPPAWQAQGLGYFSGVGHGGRSAACPGQVAAGCLKHSVAAPNGCQASHLAYKIWCKSKADARLPRRCPKRDTGKPSEI